MPRNALGELRRSAVVMTFGPGAIVDFRADGAPVSAVSAGLELWDSEFPPAGTQNSQSISEPRLEGRLGVAGFRLPPVVYDPPGGDSEDTRTLVGVRFPQWLQCPRCDRIAPGGKWSQAPGSASRYCARCTAKAPGQRRVHVVPTRFVMACPKGHLDEFPWHYWVEHKASCSKKEKGKLYLRSERPGLAGLILSCADCGARKSMDGIFGIETWKGFTCKGRRPWLAAANQPCKDRPRTLQRGASNIYFPVMASALSIPPWTDTLQEALADNWQGLVNATPEERKVFVKILADGPLAHLLTELGGSLSELVAHVEARVSAYDDEQILDIRDEEYRQIALSAPACVPEFETRAVDVPEALRPFISRVVRVVRLREVRALRSFTRINPPGPDDSPDYASISAGRLNWLPAIEVRGEGIFLTLNPDALTAWEGEATVVDRAPRVNRAWCADWDARYGGEPERAITPRFLLLHTFAHALVRQLTLESGYSSAALRERLYVGEGPKGMMGLLIYTATSDSDGTLGGLQRQGEPIRLERTVVSAIRAMAWCSSDPLCIDGIMSAHDGFSLASCHACVMAPETACEEFNRFLDRALLVGLPDEESVGFFAPFLA